MPHELGGGEAPSLHGSGRAPSSAPTPPAAVRCRWQAPLCFPKRKARKHGQAHHRGTSVRFEVQYGKCPKEYESFKVGRSAVFKCPCCGEITTDAYVKQHGKAHEMGSQLMAVVGEGKHGRIYLSPDVEQTIAADVPAPESYPSGAMPENPRWFSSCLWHDRLQ